MVKKALVLTLALVFSLSLVGYALADEVSGTISK